MPIDKLHMGMLKDFRQKYYERLERDRVVNSCLLSGFVYNDQLIATVSGYTGSMLLYLCFMQTMVSRNINYHTHFKTSSCSCAPHCQ